MLLYSFIEMMPLFMFTHLGFYWNAPRRIRGKAGHSLGLGPGPGPTGRVGGWAGGRLVVL